MSLASSNYQHQKHECTMEHCECNKLHSQTFMIHCECTMEHLLKRQHTIPLLLSKGLNIEEKGLNID